jgi:hypothetical protein
MPTPLPLNPTPRQEYQAKELECKKLMDMLVNPTLRQAFGVALLQLQRKLTSRESVDGNTAASSFMKIQGAQEFLDILIELPHISIKADVKQDPTKLHYKA